MERTFVMVKPDGVRRGLMGEIVLRLESLQMEIVEMSLREATERELNSFLDFGADWAEGIRQKVKDAFSARAEEFAVASDYAEKVRKWLKEYLSSGPLLLMVVEGPDAIILVKKLAGATDPASARPGSIRGDYANDTVYAANKDGRANRTIMHAPSTRPDAEREISIFFPGIP